MGDKQTFLRSLIDELSAPLTRFLASRLHNEDDARDLAQEAFLRISNLDDPEELTNARAFLFQTAANLVVDKLRRERVHDRYLEAESAAHHEADGGSLSPSAERTVAAEEQLRMIYQTIEGLSPNCRQAFLLHRANNMTYSGIAQQMGISTSMVEKYVIEALRACRQALVEADGEP